MLIGSPQAVAGQAGESEKTPQAIEATDAVLKGASLTLKVDGMVCPFCAYGLEKRLRELPALDETLIQMSDGLVQIRVKEGEQYITELEWFVKGGYTKPEVLVAATKDSAEILGMDDKLGTLEPGKLADVLVVEGRPDETLRDLENVNLVIRDGYVVVEDGRVFIPRHVPVPEPTPREGSR